MSVDRVWEGYGWTITAFDHARDELTILMPVAGYGGRFDLAEVARFTAALEQAVAWQRRRS